VLQDEHEGDLVAYPACNLLYFSLGALLHSASTLEYMPRMSFVKNLKRDNKPWALLGLSRREYEARRPWKAAKVSRAEFEDMICQVPPELIDEIKLHAHAEALVESVFWKDCFELASLSRVRPCVVPRADASTFSKELFQGNSLTSQPFFFFL